MYRFLLTTILGSAFALSSWASAVGPSSTLIIGGEKLDLPATWQSPNQGKIWGLSWQSENTESPLQSIALLGDIDPNLVYAVGLINPFAVATTFDLTILIPYIGGPYDRVTLSHASTATDGNQNGAATVALNTEAHIANALLDGTVVTGLSTGCSITPPPFSQSCFSGANSVVPVASGLAGTFGVRLTLTLSPFDAYSATGTVTLDNTPGDPVVPEPATMLVLGSGLMLLAVSKRFKSN